VGKKNRPKVTCSHVNSLTGTVIWSTVPNQELCAMARTELLLSLRGKPAIYPVHCLPDRSANRQASVPSAHPPSSLRCTLHPRPRTAAASSASCPLHAGCSIARAPRPLRCSRAAARREYAATSKNPGRVVQRRRRPANHPGRPPTMATNVPAPRPENRTTPPPRASRLAQAERSATAPLRRGRVDPGR